MTGPEEESARLRDAPRSDEVFQVLAQRYHVAPMPVLEARDLVDTSHPLGEPKRFLRVQLPPDMPYRTGDHLALLPRNPEALVRRVAARLGLELTHTVTLEKGRRGLPVGVPLTVHQLLTEFVELRFPPSAISVAKLADHASDDGERHQLAALAALGREEFREQVTERERTVLDLLEEFPSCALTLDAYLDLVRPIRLRSYSLSSSPLDRPHEAELLVSFLDEPHRAGLGTYTGVASAFLWGVEAGDVLHARTVSCQEAFRLPDDPSIPVILISAGTGLAPFRAAIADRRHAPRGTVLCYFGCRHPDVDFLHREELEAADAAGVISLRPVFSRAAHDGVRYVQHRIAREGDEVWRLLEQGAHVRVCGDGRYMAPDVRAGFRQLFRDHTDGSEEDAEAWLHDLMISGRYVEDVWAG
ncbi:hypothetical protein H5392_04395 [Tessaracoccus sp. MC1865]|uniref:hypothetical protein n=1 Tax=Tessaracoccus sp. MC1865 TaxID=2760310 RepID=UPI0015FFEC00|nr:hypothetical protein [Tessaracoccus sp. MC1865]MBB1483100.1 hypothetical protein [Tessaracoccus sp. MC1865]QTO37470.1 hypothetical protein J7D54_13825 [Tessaracoccus sp. MC1865]